MLRFKFRSIVGMNMRRLTQLIAVGAMVLSSAAAQADLGDQLFKLLPHDGAAEDRFGRSVAISGTTAIVGVPKDDDNGNISGSAYLFDTTTGQQLFKLLPADNAVNDQLGYSVAISGTTAIAGAIWDNDNGWHSGSAYLFDTTTGSQIAKLLADDGAQDDYFGVSVAISGATAIVGAYGDDNDNGDRAGSVYVFDTNTGEQIAKLLADDGATFDSFGGSVALSGTTAIVGAMWHDDNGGSSGTAYVFDLTTGQQIAKLLADDGAADDRFGISVAISGATAIVGAYGDDDNGDWSGSAYLFDAITGQQIAKLLPADGAETDFFGWFVAISGTTAIVGATGDDDNGTDSGSTYLFDAGGAPACPWDFDGDSAVGPFDLALLLGNWGPCADPDNCPADLDGNSEVGPFDLALLLGNWGPCPAIVCLDPKTDPTDLNCQAAAECEIDGEVVLYDLFECHCLEGAAEEQCCEAILEGFETSCESSGGTFSNFFCNCFP